MTEISDDQAVAAREANCRQADYFREELRRRIALLDDQSENFRSKLAEHAQCSDEYQIRRIQHELHRAKLERSELIEMLTALDRRFVDHNR